LVKIQSTIRQHAAWLDARQWFLVPQEEAWPAPSRWSGGCAARAAAAPDLLNTLAANLMVPASPSSPPPAPLVSAASSGPTVASHSNSMPFSSRLIRPNWISTPAVLCLRPYKSNFISNISFIF